MLILTSGLPGLIVALTLALPASAQNVSQDSGEESFKEQRTILKEMIRSDLEQDVALSFVHQGTLPDANHAPAFWSLIGILGATAELSGDRLHDVAPFVVAQAAAHLLPSCRVPYEILAAQIAQRAGSGIEAMDMTETRVRDLLLSETFGSRHDVLINEARRELVLATDLTCKVLAPRAGHVMTAVAAMRLAGEPPKAPSVPAPPREAATRETCLPNVEGMFP